MIRTVPRAWIVPLHLAMLLGLAPLAPAQPVLDPTEPIHLEADSSDFDRRRNVVVFQGLRISQGPLQIHADRAQASQIDFEDAIWEFTGNVRIELDQAQLRSSEAQLTFRGFRLTHAVATGSPAQFEDAGTASGRLVRGRAGKVEYDITSGILRLSGQAWLAEGPNEITGATLIYNVPEERVLAEGDGDRVRITIVPPPPDDASREDTTPGNTTGEDPEAAP